MNDERATVGIHYTQKVWNQELWRQEYICRCGSHTPATHNAYCYYCCLWLVEQVVQEVEQVVEIIAEQTPVAQEADEQWMAQVQKELSADLAAGEARGLVATSVIVPDDGSGYQIQWSNPNPVIEVVKGLSYLSDEYETSKATSSRGKQYDLVIKKANGMAVDCTCPDREHRGRLQGRACKHMMKWNEKKPATPVAA